jgi:DNA modification methylase
MEYNEDFLKKMVQVGTLGYPLSKIINVLDLWQKYASPVWMDIDYGDTLQGFRNGRDEKDEKHICPLQLDTIKRLIHLYTNKGDKVFTPFMGIGSEVYQAVKMERIGVGIELKESYFEIAKSNVRSAVESKKQIELAF